MDNHLITSSTSYQKVSTLTQQKPSNNTVVKEISNEAQPSVRVDISDEAKTKELQDSNQQALRKLMGKEPVERSQGSDDKPTLDEMIAELQEEITQLNQEMAHLRSKGDDESLADAKSLEVKIASLTAQLMDLLTQKVEQGESNAL